MADKLKYAIGNAASTTLAVGMANSDTSMTITSDTNFAAKTGEGMIIIDESQVTEEITYSTTKSGATLTTTLANRGLEGGSPQAHAINATVKGILTAGMWNDLVDAMTNIISKSTGAVDSSKVAVISGGYATTLTTTAATNVTLPTTGTVSTLAGTETLTNKRITKRIGSSVSAATHTINSDSYDEYIVTAQGEAVEFVAPTGTPTQGQTLVIRIKDDGTGRAITWNAIFRAIGVTLPTTTVASKTHYVGCIYNSTNTKWDAIAVVAEA